MDYDLWVRISKLAPLLYTQQLWANFRLHESGKSVVSDDRCWPEMLRVHYRDGGSWFSPLVFKARLRPVVYSWIPVNLKVRIRQVIRRV